MCVYLWVSVCVSGCVCVCVNGVRLLRPITTPICITCVCVCFIAVSEIVTSCTGLYVKVVVYLSARSRTSLAPPPTPTPHSTSPYTCGCRITSLHVTCVHDMMDLDNYTESTSCILDSQDIRPMCHALYLMYNVCYLDIIL